MSSVVADSSINHLSDRAARATLGRRKRPRRPGLKESGVRIRIRIRIRFRGRGRDSARDSGSDRGRGRSSVRGRGSRQAA